MKFLSLLKGELKASLTKLPFIILFIGLCLAAVLSSLPLHMLQRGEEVGHLEIAISTPSNTNVFEQMISFVKMDEHIADISLVEPEEGMRQVQEGTVDFYLEFPDNLEGALFDYEEATINLRSSNPILGSIAYQILHSAVHSLNQMQSSSLTYYQALKKGDFTRKERSNLGQAFDLQLLQMALLRGNSIETVKGVSQYYLQALSLVLFLSTSIVVCYYAVVIARQMQDQVFRKLLLYNYSFTQIWLSKLTVCLLLIVPIILFSLWIFHKLQLSLNLPYLIISEVVLMILLFSITIGLTSLLNRSKHLSNVLLTNTILLLLMMFLGGLIYPSYSQTIRWNAGNPAWLTQILAETVITSEMPDLISLVPYLLLSVAGYLLTIKRWEGSL